MRRSGTGSNATRLMIAGLLTAAACSGESAQTATTMIAPATTSTAVATTTTLPPPATTSTTVTTTTEVPATTTRTGDPMSDREAYIAASLTTAPEDSPDFDTSCASEGVVDAIGFETLVDLDISPEELFEAESFVSLNIEFTRELRAGLTDVFRQCTNVERLAVESIAASGVELHPVVEDCMIAGTADLLAEVQAVISIDPEIPFGEDIAIDAATIGARCGILAIRTADGADVVWDDGENLFVEALTTQLAASSYEDISVGVSDEEAGCFASGAVEIFGGAILSTPGLTAGDLGLYLRQAIDSEAIPFIVSPDHASLLAHLFEVCVDIATLNAASASLALESSGLDLELVSAFTQCFTDNYDPLVAHSTLYHGFLYGSSAFDRLEFREGLVDAIRIGELCGVEVFG
jgi:hypothetical protein